jgi:hypothetical protein
MSWHASLDSHDIFLMRWIRGTYVGSMSVYYFIIIFDNILYSWSHALFREKHNFFPNCFCCRPYCMPECLISVSEILMPFFARMDWLMFTYKSLLIENFVGGPHEFSSESAIFGQKNKENISERYICRKFLHIYLLAASYFLKQFWLTESHPELFRWLISESLYN